MSDREQMIDKVKDEAREAMLQSAGFFDVATNDDEYYRLQNAYRAGFNTGYEFANREARREFANYLKALMSGEVTDAVKDAVYEFVRDLEAE